MTTTFDGSTPGAEAPETTSFGTPVTPAIAEEARPDSLLDQLRDRVGDRDEDEPAEWFDEIPKVGIRLVCDPDIDAEDFRRWTRAAMGGNGPGSKGRRRRSGSSPMDMSQKAIAVRALVAQNLRLEIRHGDEWRVMNGRDGQALTLESNELMTTFGVMDAATLLKRLYGRDARVIEAGQGLLAEAGYLDKDDDEDDESPI